MAKVSIPEERRTLTGRQEITEYLASCGIDYEQWPPKESVQPHAPPEEILAVYAKEIEELKARGGYVTADIIDVSDQTPGLEGMLAKFNREHWHDEDEVRFIIAGHGLFHIHPKDKPVMAIEVEAGDLIRVPRGTLHWFDLCSDRRIRAIRLFQDTAGWTPHYSESKIEDDFQPLCFGLSFLPQSESAGRS
jgi:1,2-dihydroxy-3-keto-5-methylthiopentene dioxygenase